MAWREDGRNDIPSYVRAKGNIDEQVGILEVIHDPLDGGERDIALGRINKNEVQAAIWQAIQNSAQAGSVAVIANHGLGDVGGIQGFDALIEDVHDALAGINEDAFFEFGKLFMTDDGQSSAVHLGAVIAGDAPAGAAANFHIVQALPSVAHAAGEDAEILDEAVNFIVGPFADAPHRQAVNGGHDLGAKSICINVIPLGAVAALAFGVTTLT